MTIRQRLPWSLRLTFITAVLAVIAAALLWVYHLGGDLTGTNLQGMREQISSLSQQVNILTKENSRLSGVVDAGESQLNMMKASRDQLSNQVTALEAENLKIKEDLAFFDSLLPTNLGSQGLTIQRLQVDKINPTQLRYRLLVLRGQRRTNDFVGQLAFDVTVLKNGKSQLLHFPSENSDAEKDHFQLSFKYYQRVDGMLTLPEGVVAKSIQVKVIYNGQARVQQTVNL